MLSPHIKPRENKNKNSGFVIYFTSCEIIFYYFKFKPVEVTSITKSIQVYTVNRVPNFPISNLFKVILDWSEWMSLQMTMLIRTAGTLPS